MKGKRILALGLAISLSMSTLSACDMVNTLLGKDEHTHLFEGAWQMDELDNTLHYRTCECGEKETAEHLFTGELKTSDGLDYHWYECECGAIQTSQHVAVDNSWKHNSSAHWQLCECGAKVGYTKHFGGEATCTEKADCEVCGKEYGKVSGHTYSALKELEEGVKGYACDCGDNIPLLTTENEEGYRENGLIDFVVEVEEGRDPVILQLSDTQFTDAQQESKCFKYVRETVAATKPDLIIITGDLVYGRFDKNGTLFKNFIQFMEGLKTPWAPVFGNHDNECWLGVDWQCQQLEAAEYCLFEQNNLTGNGNYTVGIMQGNELLRVFYMMDSNGCANPRISGDGNTYTTNPEVTPGKNVVKTTAGFRDDQTAWFSASMSEVSSVSPTTKFSMAYHIQQAYFIKAYDQYDYRPYTKEGSSSELRYALNLDVAKMINTETWEVEKELEVKAGDIGYLGRTMKGAWDTNFSVFSIMKQKGVDSIFVGHEHCNSASVVFEGVRFQFSQKSSTYDRYNSLDSKGHIIGSYTNAGTPLIGGTAFSLSQEDGTIINPYIYLYGNPLGTNPLIR